MTSRRHALFAAATTALIVVDLATKVWAVRVLDDGRFELPGPLDLQLSYNDGIAFGLLDRLPAVLLICASLVIAALLVRAWSPGQTPTVPTAMIVAGAVANSLDRLEAGSVVDMLHLGWWPTFNVADIYITGGVVLWMASSVWSESPPSTSTDHIQIRTPELTTAAEPDRTETTPPSP